MHTDQAISNIRCQVEDTEFKIQGWALPTVKIEFYDGRRHPSYIYLLAAVGRESEAHPAFPVKSLFF